MTASSTTNRWLAVCLAIVVTILLVACGEVPDDDSDSGVSQGVGSKDASADINGVDIGEADAIGCVPVKVHVTNNSSKTSDYYVELNVMNAAGQVIGYTNAVINHLEPGNQAAVDAVAVCEGDVQSVEVTEVQRTASA